ncbi:MAG TPA: hypothetical protein VGX22_07285, partial [Candidatus Dormibacteraeota bacterium]|nr:hypothetical protein [Candidatus Dormibacteraeota bacterium]
MSRRLGVTCAALFTCVLSAALVFTRPAPESYDAQIMYQVTQSLVDHGNFIVHRDPFAMNIPYSHYGIGMSVLMAVPYWLAERLRQDPAVWAMAVNAVVLAAISVTVLALGLAAGATAPQSLAAAMLTAFGTLLFPYVATGFSEPSIALAIMLGLLAIQTRHPAAAGAASGLALLMRIDSALLVVPVLGAAAWVAEGRSRKAALRFAAGLLPAVIITGAYDTLRFGAPWSTGYSFATFNHPLLAGLYGLLLSPAAGLFIYVPLLPLALVGLYLLALRLPVLAVAASVLLGIRIVLYAMWFAWAAYWAWGPRYLVAAMPAVAVGLIEICRRWSVLRPVVKAGAALLLALSVSVQLIGAAVQYDHAAMFAALLRAHPPISGPGFVIDESNPTTEAVFDRIYFDWSLWPIPDEAGDLLHGRFLAGHWLAPDPNLPAIAT